jgi:hypothetical protein
MLMHIEHQRVLGERMNWITRYVDEPLLQGAAALLKRWHQLTGQRPDMLEPVWHVLAVSVLMIASLQFLTGPALLLSQGALIMLAVPSALRLMQRSPVNSTYSLNDYKTMRAAAIDKRENEWALRMAVLVGSATLPLAHPVDDMMGTYFMLGASLWFASTAPLRFYLSAAEPPAPGVGDRFSRRALGSATS